MNKLNTKIKPKEATEMQTKNEQDRQQNKTSKWEMIGKRLAAFILDRILIGIAVGIPSTYIVMSAIINKNVFLLIYIPLLVLIVAFAYFVLMEYKLGYTLGKKALNLVVLNKNGGKISFVSSVIRNLLKFTPFLGFLLIIDFIGILTTENQQRFTELIAKTIVIENKNAGKK